MEIFVAAARVARRLDGSLRMGSIGPTELIIIAGVAILLFGGSRIADLGKGFGQAIKNFKAGVRDEPAPKDDA